MASPPTDIRFEWIDDARAFDEFVSFTLGNERYFLDTEFHREKTYYPQLALVQIAAGGRIGLIDPLIVDPRLLGELFESDRLCVLHAAQQDLDVLRQVCGVVPSRILDTQLCAGFLGHSQPSLVSLVHSFLRVTIPKGDRLSDWLRRPLTRDQKLYAAADVAYLEQLADLIVAELRDLNRMEWALEACEELRTRPMGPAPTHEAWLRVKDVRSLRGKSRWVARELAKWREERAMDLDLPPRHVMADLAVLGVAQRAPRTVEELSQCRGVDGRHLRGGGGSEIIAAVRRGLDEATQGELRFPEPEGEELDRSMRPAVTLVSAWVTELARESRLDAGLLGTRRDIVDLLSGDPSARLRHGWRAEIVGRDLEDLVTGRKALTFSAESGGRGLRLVDIAPK